MNHIKLISYGGEKKFFSKEKGFCAFKPTFVKHSKSKFLKKPKSFTEIDFVYGASYLVDRFSILAKSNNVIVLTVHNQ